MDISSLDSANRSLDLADGLTGRRADADALRLDCVRAEAPGGALEAATGRSGSGTIHPPPGTPGGAMGQ
jgi:hypothetical protein